MNKAEWNKNRPPHLTTRSYKAWTNMRTRCNNPNATQYKDYGGRGIKVCERWNSYKYFLEDMREPPTTKHTLDRIDYNGNYEPNNCRWATWQEQQQHRRPRKNTVWLTYQGETLSVTDWAHKLGISRFVVYERIKAGWNDYDALTFAIRKNSHL